MARPLHILPAGREEVRGMATETTRDQSVAVARARYSALTMLGRGTVVYDGAIMESSVALKRIGLRPWKLAAKEGLALLNGTLHEDAGEFSVPPQWRQSEVEQNMPETDNGATDYVLEGDLPLVAARAALEAAEAANDGHAMADAHALLGRAYLLTDRPAAAEAPQIDVPDAAKAACARRDSASASRNAACAPSKS